MANYPTALPSATPATHGEVLAEVRAIAVELGLNPSDTSTDVAARFVSVLAEAVQRSNHTGTQLASTISDFASAASAAVTDLTTVTYAGDLNAARPTVDVVVWEGFPGQPTNMANGDLWIDPATDGAFLVGTVDPTSSDGNNGDTWFNKTSKTIFAPKASGSWPTGVSLVGPTGATGPTGPTGAAGSGYSAGSWQTISLGSSMAAVTGYYAPAYRLEAGDIVRFRGAATTVGTITADSSLTNRNGTVLFNVATGFRPSSVVLLDATSNNAATWKLVIDTTGDVTASGGSPAAGSIFTFDGLAFTL